MAGVEKPSARQFMNGFESRPVLEIREQRFDDRVVAPPGAPGGPVEQPLQKQVSYLRRRGSSRVLRRSHRRRCDAILDAWQQG